VLAAKKDSVLVIDFWATWCKPCLEEAPYFAALKKSMANQKVSFIAISLDKDRAAWQNFFPKNKVANSQNDWLLLNHFNSPLAKRFQITSIPRVVVIKGGKVVAMDAPPPSSPQLKKLIEKHIGQ
jgi:thiol-disulfide isomerase/thioredoxin